MFVDVLNEFLNWDSKFFATIGLLIVKPWRLTNEFLAGHRARYVHPLRLYLLASILFFFGVNYWAKSIHLQPGKLKPEDKAEVEKALDKEDLTPEQRAAAERALKMTKISPEPAAEVPAKVNKDDLRSEIRRKIQEAHSPNSPAPTASAKEEEKASPKPEERGPPDSGDFGPMLHFGSEKPTTRIEKWLQARAKEKIGEHGTNAQLFLQTVISNLPYMVLCCIPLFAFVLKILYIRKKVYYIDHLIYALHVHSFAYLAVMMIVLATLGLERKMHNLAGLIIALLWTMFALQIFLSIRRVYKQGWFFTVFKFLVGGFVYLIVLCVALAATFFITLALP